jgi:hypothetical protein
MKLIMIVSAAALAMALPALGQQPSPPAESVGSGTATAVRPGHMVGKPVAPTARQDGSSQRRKATAMLPRPGSVPANGTDKPTGTTGAPPYGSSTPPTNSSTGASDEPHGG